MIFYQDSINSIPPNVTCRAVRAVWRSHGLPLCHKEATTQPDRLPGLSWQSRVLSHDIEIFDTIVTFQTGRFDNEKDSGRAVQLNPWRQLSENNSVSSSHKIVVTRTLSDGTQSDCEKHYRMEQNGPSWQRLSSISRIKLSRTPHE